MQNRKDDVYDLLDRIVTLHELQASLEDIDVEVAKARVLLTLHSSLNNGLDNTE